MFDIFHQSNDINTLRCINQTFITLILKKSKAEKIQDYRPISLLNSSYKIISKCLAARFYPMLNSILNDSQSVFLLGRNSSPYAYVTNPWTYAKVRHSERFR